MDSTGFGLDLHGVSETFEAGQVWRLYLLPRFSLRNS